MTRSVLVVDDHPSPATSAAHALEAAGYIARVATSVDAALVELADRPDAVVLDHCLDRDASLLRLALVRARVPVVLVSGLDDEAARGCAEAHRWAFLPKPFDDVALTAAVASLFPPETPVPERNSPDPRASIVPDLPPAPASIAPREAPLPAPPAAPTQFTPSGRPLAPSKTAEVLDRVGDIIGCLLLFQLCRDGKIGGVETMFAIGAILGVNNGVRQYSAARVGGAGVGLAGLLVLFGARWLAPAAAAGEIARASGMFGLLAMLALGAVGCGGGPLVQSPGAALALRVAWPSIHKGAVNGGLCQDDPPEWLVGPTPKDGGAEAGAEPPAPSGPGPSPAAAGDASQPGPADAAAEGDR